MKLLIRQVEIADPTSAFNGKIVDVFIVDGNYHTIASSISTEKIPADTQIIEEKNCCLSIGWMDMRSNFREPGEEQKETIKSGQEAAAQGGFTAVLLMPSTKPEIQTRADVEFVMKKSEANAVTVFQAGALTKDCAGKELNELYDMQLGGAIVFCDDKRSIADSGVMMRAMQYAGNINTRIIAYADDKGLSRESITNESAVTTLLGFKGSPSIAEEIDVQRLVTLTEYTGQHLHISGVSSKAAVEVIRNAKARGVKISAEVYVYHLLLSDESLNEFGTNYKVKPPLRSEVDCKALIDAVIDGTIDVVVSDHSPEDPESKVVEFDYAAFGMIGLESAFGVLQKALGNRSTPNLIAKILSVNPRKILGLPTVSIQENKKADCTLFSKDEEWVFTSKHIKSLSRNTPFMDMKFIGKVKGIYSNSQWVTAE